MLTEELREDFIRYFKENGHRLLGPSKVFTDDPTIFFTTAGMVQLKPKFLGLEPFEDKFSMLTNCQPCIRAGGKHNDLDDVGLDTYHLTSFNMLGNWSLNKYWKQEAITLAFNYFVKLGLDVNRMYATYFEGEEENNLPEDTESRDIWLQFLQPNHVVKGSKKDNFWSLGGGPSGPCTEIHYDIVEGRSDVPELVNADDPTLIELWNIVLMQYNEVIDKETGLTTYTELSQRFVDTGAGLERLAMVLQNKTSIYQTDVFRKLIKYIEIISGKEYQDRYGKYDSNFVDTSMRIFADHMRTLVIALYDGAVFDSHNRGFIMRKIIRRMLSHYYFNLNNYEVHSVMSHHIISALITEILNFYMLYKHDANKIKQQLVEEEKNLMGQINKFKLMYNSRLKYKTPDEIKQDFLNKATVLKDTHGIDIELIPVIDLISVTMPKELSKEKTKNSVVKTDV
jgi:alanyl-tRNA synthetase